MLDKPMIANPRCRTTLFALTGLLGVACAACNSIDSVREEELARVASPNGRWEAVLTRDAGAGATVGSMYYLYLVDSGASEIAPRDLMRATRVDLADFELVWESDELLHVVHGASWIWGFKNFWYGSSPDSVVELRLRPVSKRSLK